MTVFAKNLLVLYKVDFSIWRLLILVYLKVLLRKTSSSLTAKVLNGVNQTDDFTKLNIQKLVIAHLSVSSLRNTFDLVTGKIKRYVDIVLFWDFSSLLTNLKPMILAFLINLIAIVVEVDMRRHMGQGIQVWIK